jgi:predicted ATPase
VDDTAEEKLAKLETLLAQSKGQPDEIGFIAGLLSIPNRGRYSIPELSPQKRREKTLTALLAQLERLAARQPVLAVYEDAHWIDPTTLELLTLMIEQIQNIRVLLLITARPEFKQSWPAYIKPGRTRYKHWIALVNPEQCGRCSSRARLARSA